MPLLFVLCELPSNPPSKLDRSKKPEQLQVAGNFQVGTVSPGPSLLSLLFQLRPTSYHYAIAPKDLYTMRVIVTGGSGGFAYPLLFCSAGRSLYPTR